MMKIGRGEMMKISFEVPKGFRACGITMVFDDEDGLHMYSTTVTLDEVAGEKVVMLPDEKTERVEVNKNDAE